MSPISSAELEELASVETGPDDIAAIGVAGIVIAKAIASVGSSFRVLR